jgi:hypothetical protein
MQIIKSHLPNEHVVDPIKYLRQTRNTKRGKHDFHMSAKTHLQTLHSKMLASLRQSFSLKESHVCTKSGNRSLDLALGKALSEGSPAEFTHSQELCLYTTYRLAARSQYLFMLLLSELSVCAAARQLLLPVVNDVTCGTCDDKSIETKETVSFEVVSPPHKRTAKHPTATPPTPVRVCAIGGGPGFEHVALCSVASYLARVQGVENISPPPIHTTLYDLYADHWRPKMKVLNDAQQLYVPQHAHTRVQTMPLDLRQSFHREANISTFDIFLMCYVLHENASYLIHKSQPEDLQEGCITEILQQAKSGAVILCCDASNRLWPTLTHAAHQCGWRVELRPEKNVPSGGPKSCWCAIKK